MDKKTLVLKLLQRGHLTTPELLPELTESNYSTVGAEQTIITSLENGVAKPIKAEETDVVDISTKTVEQVDLTPQSYISNSTESFETLKSLLLRRISAVSISNMQKEYGSVSVIGRIKEKNEQGFVLEDTTGVLDVVWATEISLGDVVGVKGVFKENKLIAESVVLPDIALTHKFNHPTLTKLFTTLEGLEKSVSSHDMIAPTTITLSENKKTASVLFLGDEKNPKKTLEKRYTQLPEHGNIVFVLEPLPSVIWVLGEENKKEIYKGVTILHMKEGSSATINFETMDIVFSG